MYSKAIERADAKIILEAMRNLLLLSAERLADAQELILLKDIIRQNNGYVEPLIKDAVVPAISDRG